MNLLINYGIKASQGGLNPPVINFVSKTQSSLTFTITNPNNASVQAAYELGDSTPDANTISIGANATSSNITFSALSSSTSYTLYVEFDSSGDVVSQTQTTEAFIATSYTGNQVPWRSNNATVGGQYFTSSTAYNLPKYPQGLSVTAFDPTWNNTDFNPDTSVLGFRFAIKMTSNGFPNTSNSCATPAYLLLISEDINTGAKYYDWVIGPGGNTPGSGCGFINVGYPYTISSSSNGVPYTQTFYSKGSGATSIELTIDNRLIVNGTQRRTNLAGLYAALYAGYDGGNMTGTVQYVTELQ